MKRPRSPSRCAACGESRILEARGMCVRCYHRDRRRRLGAVRPTLIQRFEAKVRVDEASGCWIWTGCSCRDGYAQFAVEHKTKVRAARVAYELFVGPIPQGLQIDHVCHTRDISCPGGSACPHRLCVNPEHLEPVTPRENVRRGRTLPAQNLLKTHCPRGHAYDEENTRIDSRGGRTCRACRRERARERRAARVPA